jgi:PASTA domain/Regulator of chromosome condensation (RCC1) repeat
MRPPIRQDSVVWLCVLAVSLTALGSPGSAQAIPAKRVVAWGCGGDANWGQCEIPRGLSGAVTAVAAGRVQSLALKVDGTVVAWGCRSNDSGQCNVPDGLSHVTAIAADDYDSMALKNDGTVVMWGCGNSHNFGECDVPDGLSHVTAIAAGVFHSVAVKDDGTVVTWGCGAGADDRGQCDVPTGLSDVVAVAAGEWHTLALKRDGTVVAWGCVGADLGQCTTDGLSGVTAIAAGYAHNLALKDDGTVVASGCGLGSGGCGMCDVPDGLAGVSAVAARDYDSLALKSDGSVVAWGCASLANRGQCVVPAALSGVTAIAAGWFHSLALADLLNQTLTFVGLPDRTFGDADFAVRATASSGLPVSFSASGNCTVSGVVVHITGAGSCTITGSQSGDDEYNPAAEVSQRFAIARSSQTISFESLSKKTYGDRDFRLQATASSGLPVSFVATGKCAVAGVTMHLTGAGSCTITAKQPGDVNYDPAASVSRTFSIAPAPCIVPRVVGKRLASAKRSLRASHCEVGTVRRAKSRRRSGTVVSQSRRPGRVLPPRASVNLVVSWGRR